MTKHTTDRLSERMEGVVGAPQALLKRVCDFAKYTKGAVAVLAHVLDRHHGDCNTVNINSRASNGDEVWFVIRDKRVVTVMFRRSNQPKRCDRFDVNAVIDISKGEPRLLDTAETIQWRKAA